MAKFCGKTDSFSPENREILRLNQFETSAKFKTITQSFFFISNFDVGMFKLHIVGTFLQLNYT